MQRSTLRPAPTLLFLAMVIFGRSGSAAAQTPLLEVERKDATELFQVTDEGGLLAVARVLEGTIPASGPGARFMWYPGKVALRAGTVVNTQWDDASIGPGSVALGNNTVASGSASLALNSNTEATGPHSIAAGVSARSNGTASLAAGDRVRADGIGSTAFGTRTIAQHDWSLAAGFETKATGPASLAMGSQTTAAGRASVALGTGVTAQGDGSFAFGDLNQQYNQPVEANQFWVRAFGGIGLNTGIDIGCDLPSGTGAWSCTSSKLAKEGFEDVDGEDVLVRLRNVPIQRWSYTGTSTRHIGPFAEDFHAAFGVGDGPTRIAQIDADGVALSAAQALERRTMALQEEVRRLRDDNAELVRRIEALERAGDRP